MAEAVFQPPRRKRRIFESYESPFPVDVDGKDFRIYQAEIINNNVIVRNPEDIEQLYSKGYFGKGILSRSRPVYSISDPLLVTKWQGANINLPVIASKKYQYHVQWAKSILQEQGFDDCSVTKILENYTKPLELPFMKNDGAEQTGDRCNRMGPSTENVELSRHSSTDTENVVSPSHECHNQKEGSKKACLEGDPVYDALAVCGSKEQEPVDLKEIAEVSCQKHGFLVHCGCKVKESTEQRSCETVASKECAPEYVLVQEEEEGSLCPEDNSAGEQENFVKKEKLVCRRNPFRIFEYLQLSLEEAFFLVYALGCLTIYYGEEPLTILKLWEVFSEVKPNFKTTYMAYHYFRSKGWVPKVGLKYGTDLLLYRKGPPFYHASYSVIAELVDDNFEGSLRRPLSWKSLSGLNRTTVNASKELMLCYLIRPSDMTEKEMSTPECMRRIKVQELIVTRWVSSRERSEQDEI
ncbi:tRNA-splicing endonuclease subunit Sen2 isoform X1 [Apteryx rowi]|uniref:tRNA-splicing endonuclease subunit Sen2 isoform X1 n=1 Tax=Apteryx rowi TaxID=308060 RepID=UPI0006B0FB31|nr:PREDICTED: tRNA-splicing endonuclease subunit Sen2 [Apteryx mantelli mantelli]XP_013803399.1 PREDICTED: tRNA-splicing endonuclease subunit Sen2 [Apteryx mantelli mantelli]XP_025922188.1 tRNA-splicing endonuclease subunit Sen2 isoform X1 [Apteryx rowi]XP_025922189.1 tRNA-splicing endonuclease subunit Sen2 isoform X1 [Apteryx rowi]